MFHSLNAGVTSLDAPDLSADLLVWSSIQRMYRKIEIVSITTRNNVRKILKEVRNVSELHIKRSGDYVEIEGEGSVEEVREDLTNLASDLDEIIASPRLKGFAKVVKDYLS